jgi:hypothetical protein
MKIRVHLRTYTFGGFSAVKTRIFSKTIVVFIFQPINRGLKRNHFVSNYGSAPHLVNVSRVLIYEGGSTRNTVHPLLHLPRLSATGLSSVLYITLKGLIREMRFSNILWMVIWDL